ncbi:MAG TPA: S8 family serine peptidase [Candidatus Sulfomarinibacteraceae bacterium]|nr:S8 family serine peptidase [Candidatus Sulfomarinibacteraceae bacterium]
MHLVSPLCRLSFPSTWANCNSSRAQAQFITIAAADNAFGVIGVAPNAERVLVTVLGDEGSGTFEDVIAGIVHAANVDADLINMSLGATLIKSGDPGANDPYTAREANEL